MAEAQLSIEDLGDVHEEIFDAHPKWYYIGLQLKLPVSTLDGIEAQYGSDLVKCSCELLKRWLTRVDPSPTWKALCEALGSQSVDKAHLALQVMRKHCLPEHPIQVIESQPDVESLCESEAVVQEKEVLKSHDSTSSSGVFSDEGLQERAFGCGCGKCTISSFIESGCPTPTSTASTFPYLSTEGLTSDEQEILRGKLLDEFEKITMCFSHLMSETCKSLIERGVTVLELVRVLIYLGAFQPSVGQKPVLEEKLENLRKAEHIDDVFYILRHYVSFFNYNIIEHIINELGNAEDCERLRTYKAELDEYSKRSVFECPSYSISQPDHADLVMKIEGTLEYNVKQLETFKARVSSIIHLSKYTLRLCSVEKGCLELRFQIPHFVEETIFPLSQDQQEALREQGVKKLTCGDLCYFPAKLEMPHSDKLNLEQLSSILDNASLEVDEQDYFFLSKLEMPHSGSPCTYHLPPPSCRHPAPTSTRYPPPPSSNQPPLRSTHHPPSPSHIYSFKPLPRIRRNIKLEELPDILDSKSLGIKKVQDVTHRSISLETTPRRRDRRQQISSCWSPIPNRWSQSLGDITRSSQSQLDSGYESRASVQNLSTTSQDSIAKEEDVYIDPPPFLTTLPHASSK